MTKHHASIVFGTCIALFAACGAEAAVTISTNATQNMSCSDGVCVPTATAAVLNTTDLQNFLAAGNLKIATTGSGGVQASDIAIEGAFTWSTTSTLTLDAFRAITVDQPVNVKGTGGTSLLTNDGGSGGLLTFGATGHIIFAKTSSALAINGLGYTLVNSLPGLASAIAVNPSGAFALSRSYNAHRDGTYSTAPIATVFRGTFDGLGNIISDLSIDDADGGDEEGLFAEVYAGGTVASVGLQNLTLQCSKCTPGGLVGLNEGTVMNAHVSGSIAPSVNGSPGEVGGLVSFNSGSIILSSASMAIAMSGYSQAGGLVFGNTGAIDQCYASGQVTTGTNGLAGGLAASNDGSISNSYSLAGVSGKHSAVVGGFIGDNGGPIAQTYSTGLTKDSGHKAYHGYLGGFVGIDGTQMIASAYWDTTTSGVTQLSHGAGNVKNDPGITGLTSVQLQTALPDGFDPAVWSINANINNGFPYLIANPPR